MDGRTGQHLMVRQRKHHRHASLKVERLRQQHERSPGTQREAAAPPTPLRHTLLHRPSAQQREGEGKEEPRISDYAALMEHGIKTLTCAPPGMSGVSLVTLRIL
ncbi:unnamed protein product [Lota lota]